MWSHLSLALTISSFIFLFFLSSQPHLFFLLKARQKFLSVTVLLWWYPESQKILNERGLYVQVKLRAHRARSLLDWGFTLMQF